MLLVTPYGQPPRLLGGPNIHGIGGDGYTWLNGSSGLGAAICRIDATAVRFADGSVTPDKVSSLPGCPAPNYQALQQALVQLSTVLNDQRIHPGSVDGVLEGGLPSNQVMGALVAALPHLRSKLGTVTTAALTIAFAFGAGTTRAKQEVLKYMGPLAIAIQSIAALKGGTASSSDGGALMPLMPWYKTWWGAGSLVLGAVTLIYLISSRRGAA